MWIDAGSRAETNENNGTAHFLEHLAFKVGPLDSLLLGVKSYHIGSEQITDQGLFSLGNATQDTTPIGARN